MEKVKPVIGRVGGKSRLAPWILEHLSRFQWSIYCEPFAGSAAVYFRLVSDGVFEQIRDRGHHPRIVLNDADSRIVQLFRTVRDHPEALAHAVRYTPYSREEHRLAQQPVEDLGDVELARRYLVDGWQSFKSMPGDSWGTTTRTNQEQVAPHVWHTLPQRILAASPHLQGDPNPVDSLDCLNEIGRRFVPPAVDVQVELARRYLVDGWQSFKKMSGDSWGVEQNCHDAKTSVGVWNTIPDRILAASPHLQGEPSPVDSPNCLNATGLKWLAGAAVEVEQARRYLVDNCQSFSKKPGLGWGIETIERGCDSIHNPWHTLPQRILTATDHLKRCYIENDDAVKVIERWATPHTAIYADPPYYDCSHYYKEQFDNDQHAQLAECLHTIEAACVIVSYYPHPEILKLYSEDDWEYHYKDTVASSAGITRNSKTRTRPKRQELLLVRKQRNPEKTTVSLSGQMNLF